MCSEEKAPLGLQENIHDFQGTFFIVATDGPDFRSLKAKEVEDVLEALAHMR